MARSKRILRRFRGQESGHPKEGSKLGLVSERGLHGFDAFVDLLASLTFGHFVKRERMTKTVRSNRMAFRLDLSGLIRKHLRHFANHKKGRLDALGRQRFENAIGVSRRWSIIECQNDFVVGERQRFWILHGADPRMFRGIDGDDTTDAKCVGPTFAIRFRRACTDAETQNEQTDEKRALESPNRDCFCNMLRQACYGCTANRSVWMHIDSLDMRGRAAVRLSLYSYSAKPITPTAQGWRRTCFLRALPSGDHRATCDRRNRDDVAQRVML